jgi:hypothetical protein
VGRHGDDLAAVLSLDFFLALDVVDIPIAECVFRSRSAFSLYRKPKRGM